MSLTVNDILNVVKKYKIGEPPPVGSRFIGMKSSEFSTGEIKIESGTFECIKHKDGRPVWIKVEDGP